MYIFFIICLILLSNYFYLAKILSFDTKHDHTDMINKFDLGDLEIDLCDLEIAAYKPFGGCS